MYDWQVKTCDGTQINPYLHAVTGVTQIVKYMTIADLFDAYGGQYRGHGESANCLVLPLSSLQAKPPGVALACFMLLKTTAVQARRPAPSPPSPPPLCHPSLRCAYVAFFP